MPQMSKEWIEEAIQQAQAFCRFKEERREFDPISLRGVLYDLGYGIDQVEHVLKTCADRGFWYCLDAAVPHQDGHYPAQSVCYWGPDQLRSRLECLHYGKED
jgi:hypothetical protein